jgi:F-box protein 9
MNPQLDDAETSSIANDDDTDTDTDAEGTTTNDRNDDGEDTSNYNDNNSDNGEDNGEGNNNGNIANKNAELWFQEDERWELTWPIWHMLSRTERKTLALTHGYKTIGEFEEYMSLQRAMGNSDLVSELEPYEEKKSMEAGERLESVTEPATTESSQDTAKRKEEDDEDHDDGGYISDSDEQLQDELRLEDQQRATAAAEDLDMDQLVQIGGMILVLPDDMLHRVFEWLPVDTYGTLALVSPHWKSFTRTETVYKLLCERLYLNQSKRRQLHVSRFGNSYRTMLEKRPRVRAGGGVYVMKYIRVKKIQRDMWTEIPMGAILENVYYRYLYFQEDGRVLYALTTSPPHEMFRRFLKVCLQRGGEKVNDKDAVWGTYQVMKDSVTVSARQPWQHVQLELTIQPFTESGRFGYLSFDRHMTSSSGSFGDDSRDRVVYEITGDPFRFVRHKRL